MLWSLMFAVGNGIMQPLEQEVARAVSDRRAHGIGPGPVIRRAVFIGVVFAAVVSVVSLATHAWILDRYLSGDRMLLIAFVVGLIGFCAGHLTRGVLSSHHRFHAYARFFSVDGVGRVVLAGLLALVGVKAVGPYGLILALTPFLGIIAALFRQHDLMEPGPEAPWHELTKALGWLLMGTVSLSLLIQGGTIAVGILSTPEEAAAAGVFLNGLQTARIPLFLFQAILASLLPKLSRLASTGQFDEFGSSLRRLVGAILGLGVVTTIAAAALGPWFVGIVFGSEQALTSRDLALLASSFILIMATICLDQALIALSGHSRMAVGWLLSLVVFIVVIAMGHDLFLRVELGLLAGSLVGFFWMILWLRERLAHRSRVHAPDLAEVVAEYPVQQ